MFSYLALRYFLVRWQSFSAVLQPMPVLPEPVEPQQCVHAYSRPYISSCPLFVCCLSAALQPMPVLPEPSDALQWVHACIVLLQSIAVNSRFLNWPYITSLLAGHLICCVAAYAGAAEPVEPQQCVHAI
jgi:hypothetical protein